MISGFIIATQAAVIAAQCSMLASMTPEEREAYNKKYEFVGPVKPDSFIERNGLLMFIIAEMSIYALVCAGMLIMIVFLVGLQIQ